MWLKRRGDANIQYIKTTFTIKNKKIRKYEI